MKRRGACSGALEIMAALVMSGCSSAATCGEGDGCAPYANRGVSSLDPQEVETEEPSEEDEYAAVLAAECAQLCGVLDACQRKIFADETRTCAEQCEEQQTQERYFNCEPLLRRYMICVAEVADCSVGECSALIETYVECLQRQPELPAAANSCVLANNGVCNEPDECLAGSDTDDCAG